MYKVVIKAGGVELSTSRFLTFQEAYNAYWDVYLAFKYSAAEIEFEESKTERTFHVLGKDESKACTVWLKHPKRKVL